AVGSLRSATVTGLRVIVLISRSHCSYAQVIRTPSYRFDLEITLLVRTGISNRITPQKPATPKHEGPTTMRGHLRTEAGKCRTASEEPCSRARTRLPTSTRSADPRGPQL